MSIIVKQGEAERFYNMILHRRRQADRKATTHSG
jgi:hypothetical protein